jgi:hypothetical protein
VVAAGISADGKTRITAVVLLGLALCSWNRALCLRKKDSRRSELYGLGKRSDKCQQLRILLSINSRAPSQPLRTELLRKTGKVIAEGKILFKVQSGKPLHDIQRGVRESRGWLFEADDGCGRKRLEMDQRQSAGKSWLPRFSAEISFSAEKSG